MTEKKAAKERIMSDESYCEPEKVEVLIRFDGNKTAMPSYAHASDAGADLCAAQDFSLAPFERALVPTGISLALPHGYVALIHPRSGLAVKKAVTVLNAPGTVDAGYRGEIKVPLINLDPKNTVSFKTGDRIAQLVIQRYAKAEFIEAQILPGSDRSENGFGSTGLRQIK